MELEIEKWVGDAPTNQQLFRKAVHIILKAVAASEYLKPHMIMKGGMLLGIRYKSSRYTKDIDFSTSESFKDFDENKFQSEFDDSLVFSAEDLAYGIDCKIQSLKVQPRQKPGVESTFPSLVISIGYAEKGAKCHKRFLEGNSINVIKIDYSFNELAPHPEELSLEGGEIIAYGLTDLIAEKIRSVMQQVVRNRQRRQDIYDLNYLLTNSEEFDDEEKWIILDSILVKSKGRLDDDFVNRSTLDDKNIYELSKQDYSLMVDEVDGDLPDFDESYNRVNRFYKDLPWDYL